MTLSWHRPDKDRILPCCDEPIRQAYKLEIVFIDRLKPNRQRHCDRKGREYLKRNAQAGWKRQSCGICGQNSQKSTGTPKAKTRLKGGFSK